MPKPASLSLLMGWYCIIIIMNPVTISTHELRVNFRRVLRSLKAGIPLILTYRNQPLARLSPITEEKQIPVDDPLYHIHEFAEDMGSLTNKQIDEIVYGNP